VTLDLEPDDAQRAIHDELSRFAADRCGEARLKQQAGAFDADLWRELAALGVLALATPEGDGGAAELCLACEALGAAVFPGPLCASVLAAQILPEAERREVIAGRAIVSLGVPPLMPFAPVATLFLAQDGDSICRAAPRGEVAAEATLGGEPWGRVALELGEALPASARAFAVHDVAFAAYTAAAGAALVARAAEHARTRRQFGRAIGEFQAVSHPLADCAIRCDAARLLARAAACAVDADEPDAATRAAAARLSARAAAQDAAHTAHQVFGAQGIALEGPVFHLSRRIRQLASQPPGDTRARAAVLAPYAA
jgi:alkylation response protein AidB-like acyl-CoA dehydrogenase